MMGLPPKETTKAIKEQLKELGELQNTAASVLYSNWILQNMPQIMGAQTRTQFQGQQEPKKDTLYEEVKQAYADAIKIKAFQSVFGSPPPIETQQVQQKIEKEEKEEEPGDWLWKAFVDLVKKDPNKAKEFLSNLTEQDIQTMLMLQNMTGKPNPLIALLQSKRMERKEDGSKNETVETAKALIEALKTGVEIGKASTPPPQQGQDSLTNTLLNAVIGLLKERRDEESRQMLGAILEAVKGKENIYEKILTDKNLQETLRNMFTGPSLPAEVRIELEKLRNDLTLKNLEWKKWLAEKQLEMKNEERKLDLVKSLLEGPTGKLISDIGKRAIEGAGAGLAAGAGVGALATAKMQQPQANVLAVKCGNCGAIFQVPEGTETVECPACKATLELKTKKQPRRKKQRVEQREEKTEESGPSETLQ